MELDVPLYVQLKYDPAEIEHRWQKIWQSQWPQQILPSENSDLLRITCLQHNVLQAEGTSFDTTGADRFLQRLWRLARTDDMHIPNLCQRGKLLPIDLQIEAATQELHNKASQQYETQKYRALIAGFMGFSNLLYRYIKDDDGANQKTLHDALDTLLQQLAPAAPHICAELWSIRHSDKNVFARLF